MIKTTFFMTASLMLAAIQVQAQSELESVPAENKQVMTQEEIDKTVGRMGDIEEIPEDFTFSDMEVRLWKTPHLNNIDAPARLYYEFSKFGSYEEGFEDSVFLDILQINEDGTKNANLEFFTAERKQYVRPDNVTNIIGNPVLGIYMQGDMYEMDRFTGGSWRHFMKQMKIAFREAEDPKDIEIEYAGEKYTAKKYTIQPFLKDTRRRQYEEFADKIYEFTFADEIPGQLYQIRTVVPPKEEGVTEPIMEEVLTLVGNERVAVIY